MRVDEVDGWETRRRPYSFAPEGVIVHHTAGTNSLGICTNGRSGLPGPLCQFLIHKDGTVSLISQGYSNHAGKGSKRVLSEVRQNIAPSGDAGPRGLSDDIGGNRYFWGIEVENLGNGKDPYPDVQLDALVTLCAALCDLYRYHPNRVIHHREWTRRKVDMSWRGDIRTLVAKKLAGGNISIGDDELMQREDRGPKVAELQKQINRVRWGHHDPAVIKQRNPNADPLTIDGHFGPTTETHVKVVEAGEGWPQTGVVDAMFLARMVHIVTYRDIVRFFNNVKDGKQGPPGPPGPPGPMPKSLVVTEWE